MLDGALHERTEGGRSAGNQVAYFSHVFEVPALTPGDADEPLDLGTLTAEPIDRQEAAAEKAGAGRGMLTNSMADENGSDLSEALVGDNPLGLEESVLRKLFFTGKTLRETAVECERFRREHGRWPASMEQLHGDSPGESGRDPFSGDPYRVTIHNDGVPAVRIWSLGPDGDWRITWRRCNRPPLPPSSRKRMGSTCGARSWRVYGQRWRSCRNKTATRSANRSTSNSAFATPAAAHSR